MYFPCRGGVRGGQDQFNWEDIKTDKFRENYLGHSLKAPVGRWQKGKDLTWYVKDKSDDKTKRQSLRALKEAEEEAMLAALGHKVMKKGSSQLTKEEVHEALKRGQTERDSLDVERVQGMGYSIARSSQNTASEGLAFYTYSQSSAKDTQSHEFPDDHLERKASSKKHRKKEKKKKTKQKRKKKTTKRKHYFSESSSEDTSSEKNQPISKSSTKRQDTDSSDSEFKMTKKSKVSHENMKRNEDKFNLTRQKNRHDTTSESDSDHHDSVRNSSKSNIRKKCKKTEHSNDSSEGKSDNFYKKRDYRKSSDHEKELSLHQYAPREGKHSSLDKYSKKKRCSLSSDDVVDSSRTKPKHSKSNGSYSQDPHCKRKKH